MGSALFAQITGTVNDGSGFPESDVEVTVKGTDKVAYTDVDGNFEIDANVGDTLVINGKEVKVTSANLGVISNSTQEEVGLDEVLILGFGQQKSVKEITGSTSTMSSKAIKDIPVASVDKMLQGRVAGVQTGNASGQPGGMANVRVRGVSSINGVVSPIWIVDGVRVSSGDLTTNNTTANVLANMNPEDIESVTVLKDAVSTAVYGADAGSGVIIITTKSGKKGDAKFNFSSSIGWNDRAVDTYRGFNAEEYKTYLATAVMNRYPSNFATVQDAREGIAGGALGAGLANVMNSTADSNWQEETMNKGFQQNIDFNVSGASDRLTYYASANYFNQESIIKNSSFKRLAYTTKIGYQATDKLKISTDLQISYSKTKTLPDAGGFANPILAAYFNRPTDAIRNEDGSYNIGNPTNGRLSNNMFNPGFLLENNYNQAQTARVFGNIKGEYQITNDLKYQLVFAPEFINVEEDTYWSHINGDGFGYSGYQRTSTNRYFNFNVQNILTWNKYFGKHNVSASAIQEAYKSDRKFLMATGIGVGSPTLNTLGNYVVPFGFNGTRLETSRWGYAVTAHYDWDKFILLDASYRRDILSQFMPGQKAGDFWSTGLGLDLARIGALKDSRAISMMKLRASYGQIGNQVTANPYGLYQFTTNYNDTPAATFSGVANPNLSWETINPFNVGIDFGFLNNRITFSAEYYNKKTKDLIYNVPLSPSQGSVVIGSDGSPLYGRMVDNVGSLVNRGFEFSLNADIFRGDRNQFNWNLGFNLSTLHNEVTELYGGDVISGTTILKEGEGVRTFYLRKWAGVDQANGNPLWYINGVDGETTSNYNEAQQAVQGSFLSDIFGGLNTTFSYKGFALDLQFTYGFGGKIYDNWAQYTFSDGQYTSNYPGYGDVMGNYWTPENTTADNPKPVYGNSTQSNRASTRFLYDSDFIRLSNARFSYTFDNELLKGSGLNSVQIYVMANNAWTHNFDDDLKFDPETNISGYTDLNLPVLKSFLLGVNVSF